MACMPDVSIVSHFKDLPDPRIERAKKGTSQIRVEMHAKDFGSRACWGRS